MNFFRLRVKNGLMSDAVNVKQQSFIRLDLLIDFLLQRLQVVRFKKFNLRFYQV
jgi:hypothetical protein